MSIRAHNDCRLAYLEGVYAEPVPLSSKLNARPKKIDAKDVEEVERQLKEVEPRYASGPGKGSNAHVYPKVPSLPNFIKATYHYEVENEVEKNRNCEYNLLFFILTLRLF